MRAAARRPFGWAAAGCGGTVESRPVSATARVPAAVFLNEGAGSARSERVRRAVDLVRRALDADLHVVATRNGSELEAFLRERIDPYATAVIAGGDGSLGIAFNVAAGRDVALGYIPAGFGNATSHLLRLPRGPEDLAAAIATGNARTLDLIRVDGRLALFAGVGWDAVVAGRYAAAGAKGLRGWATAIVGASGELARRYPVRVTVDGTVIHEGPMELLVVGTTPYYGRGMIVNPGARPDAGQFTLRLYPGPAPQLAVEAVRWFLHRSPAAPGVAGITALVESLDDRALPLQADGDLLGEAYRWEVAVVPRSVRIIGTWS
jgi:diacylglycerol kinase (ATP)